MLKMLNFEPALRPDFIELNSNLNQIQKTYKKI
jgi:hypothetical protein